MAAGLSRVVTRGRRPGLRLLALVLGALVALGAGATFGYRELRDSSLFAVRDVVVSGADPRLSPQVEHAVRDSVAGRGLLALSPGRLARTIQSEVPGVHAARVDRDFPSTLRVRIWPEHAVALAVHGHVRVVVSATGRVLRRIDNRAAPPDLPRVPLASTAPRAGERIADAQVLAELRAIDSVPAGFRGTIGWSKADRDHGLELQLRWPKLWIRLGPAVDLRQKLRAAALVLQAFPTVAAREGLSYVDVSAPARPAVMPTTPDPATASLGAAAASTGDAGTADAPTTTTASGDATTTASTDTTTTASSDTTTSASSDTTTTATTSTSANP